MGFNNRGGNHGGFANPGAGNPLAGVTGFEPNPLVLNNTDPNQPIGPHYSLGAYQSRPWPGVNRIALFSIWVSAPFAIDHVVWLNGAPVSGNVDCGLYTIAGTRLGSIGSTVQAGASLAQSVPLALTLQPGTYYIALVADNITAQYVTTQPYPNVAIHATQGAAQASADAFPLPASLTPASPSTTSLEVPQLAIVRGGGFY